MKVSEKTLTIWTVVNLHKDCIFRNASFTGHTRMVRITEIKQYDSWNIRFWKEYFCQFREQVWREDQGFIPDADKQIDGAIEEEVD